MMIIKQYINTQRVGLHDVEENQIMHSERKGKTCNSNLREKEREVKGLSGLA